MLAPAIRSLPLLLHLKAGRLLYAFLFLILISLITYWVCWQVLMIGTKTKQSEFKIRPFLHKHYPALSELNCGRLMANDSAYVAYLAANRLVADLDALTDEQLPMDCASIHARHHLPAEPNSLAEAEYPLAQARIVFKDYLLLEMDLAAAYQPQNWYCYAIDAKASERFHRRLKSLAACLPNVLVTTREWEMDSGGHNYDASIMECLRELLQEGSGRDWRYVSILENHDTTLRTNAEAVRIFQLLNGANDVEITSLPPGRVDFSADWSFATLNLFRNVSRNRLSPTPNGYLAQLNFSKGYHESSLRREMVEFMLNELDLHQLTARLWHEGRFGMDEVLVPTLHAADALQAPGGFTRACIEEHNTRVEHLTRYTQWSSIECLTQRMRHSICLLGVEDLASGNLRRLPQLFVNKFMPDFDFGAVVCWYEWIFKRTAAGGVGFELREDYYRTLPHARFQTLKAEWVANGSRPEDYRAAVKVFNCSHNYAHL